MGYVELTGLSLPRGLKPFAGYFAAWCMVTLLASCSTKVSEPDLAAEADTLLVAYVNEGMTPLPCDDLTPIVDGMVDTLREAWNLAPAQTLDLHDDSGASVGKLEIRALWMQTEIEPLPDYIYFLMRWEDTEADRTPDLLAYGAGDEHTMLPSPVPQGCDSVLVRTASWTRLFREQEDQVLVLLQDGDGSGDPASAAYEIFRAIGVESGQSSQVALGRSDVWLWRAGRTNDHPIPQYAEWQYSHDPLTDIPYPTFSNFSINSGFCEDLYVGETGSLSRDQGAWPYVRNFNPPSAVPLRTVVKHETWGIEIPVPGGTMWWPWTSPFRICDTLAVTRTAGLVGKWSEDLPVWGIDYDRMPGWGLRTPSESAVDVRARGRHVVSGRLNGWTLECMRMLDTRNTDDVAIDPFAGPYRIVIGVSDGSGNLIRVSRSIRLVFEPPSPPEEYPRRC